MTYSHNTYGDDFADVYDEWYHDLDIIDDCVEFLLQLASGGTVLELGVGTGRIAIPLASRGAALGVSVTGVDLSAAMLAQLETKQHKSARVHVVLGHMIRDMPEGAFSVLFMAYNTLFNLLSADEQSECLRVVATRLAPGGHLVVDCFVPASELPHFVAPHEHRVTPNGVVISEAVVFTEQQRVDGVYTEVFNNGQRVEHPWKIRYSSVAEIDAMATLAGLNLEQRWCDYGRNNFTDESVRHVSVYGRTPNFRA